MIIQNLDFLSPKITLYFKGNNKHSSVISGIITIISYLFILISIIYYSLDFFQKGNPTVYFFNRYIEDAGIFPLNASSIFHYLNLIAAAKVKTIGEIDFKSISIYGIQRSIEHYIVDFDLKRDRHWLYELCQYDDYNINSQKFSKLIDKNEFSKSACIKKFFSPTEKRYFNIGEPGFEWPSLNHGMSHPNLTMYGIIVEKCQNDSARNYCNSIEIIDEYLRGFGIALNFIDYRSDVLNYKIPFIQFINTITNGLNAKTQTISLNNLNFNPNIIRTHNGVIFDHFIEESKYSFSQNEKSVVEQGNKKVIASFFFLMQNMSIYNERHYKRFQDLLSNIGGVGSFILLVGFFINSFISYYIILLDTTDLLFRIEKLNTIKDYSINKPISLIRGNEVIHQLKNNNSNYEVFSLQKSNYPLFTNDLNKNENERNTEHLKLFLNLNKNNKNININKNSYQNLDNNKISKDNTNIILINNKLKSNSDTNIKKLEVKKPNFNIKDSNKNIIQKPIGKANFNWCNYILYVMLFKRNNSKIRFFEKFREQILSEENSLQNHLYINRLLEFSKIKKVKQF